MVFGGGLVKSKRRIIFAGLYVFCIQKLSKSEQQTRKVICFLKEVVGQSVVSEDLAFLQISIIHLLDRLFVLAISV